MWYVLDVTYDVLRPAARPRGLSAMDASAGSTDIACKLTDQRSGFVTTVCKGFAILIELYVIVRLFDHSIA